MDGRVEDVPLLAFDETLTEGQTPDWLIYLRAQEGGFTGVVTRDISQLEQPEELVAIMRTSTVSRFGHYPRMAPPRTPSSWSNASTRTARKTKAVKERHRTRRSCDSLVAVVAIAVTANVWVGGLCAGRVGLVVALDSGWLMNLQVGDVRLHVSVDGEANRRSLLLLHGLTDSMAYYRWVVLRLSDRYRVVTLDFRGHGQSDRAERYVTPDFVDDAVAVCDRVAGAGCVVIAHSFGGLIGAALAQQRPDLVRAVFLEDPLLIDPAVRSDLLGDDGIAVRDVFAGAKDYLAMIAGWQRDGVSIEQAASVFESMMSPLGVPYAEAYFPDSIRSIAEAKLQFDLRILDDFATARSSRTAGPVFDPDRPIDVPGHLLAGDPSVPGVRTRSIDVERLRATSPKIHHQTVKGAGHFIHDGRNSRASYTDALMSFLSGLDH